jgi:hypothetical protein
LECCDHEVRGDCLLLAMVISVACQCYAVLWLSQGLDVHDEVEVVAIVDDVPHRNYHDVRGSLTSSMFLCCSVYRIISN